MGNSKVVFNAKVLIDLTKDTVAAAKLLEGATAHGKDGERVTGTIPNRNTVGKQWLQTFRPWPLRPSRGTLRPTPMRTG